MRIFSREYIEVLIEQFRGSIIPYISRIKIGAWDMPSTRSISFTFGSDLGFKNIKADSIIFCFAIIFGDDGSKSISMKDIYFSWDDTTFKIWKTGSSLYNTTNYDDTTINRGYMFLLKY